MSVPTDTTASLATSARAKWSRSRKAFAVAGVLILVFVGGYIVYGYLNGLPPDVVSTGPQGHAFLDVALMTFYTPAVPGASGFNASLTVTFAAATRFPFSWAEVSGTDMPVRFILTPSALFVAGSPDGFVFNGWGGPGPSSIGVDRPEPPSALVHLWAMAYTVREMSAWRGFTKATWLEVVYSLTPVALNIGVPLPIANVSVPTASELIPTGIVDSLNLSTQPGYVWTLERGLSNSTIPSSPFQHTLPAVSFDGGGAGKFTAALTSSFTWGKGDDYRVSMSVSGTAHGTLTWYWDERFGSLFTVFSP